MANVSPRIWDDERVLRLDDGGRAMWFFLITAPQDVPGLVRVGIANLTEILRRTAKQVSAHLQSLIDCKLIEFDATRRLVWVPSAPKYQSPGTFNVIRGWFRKWLLLPESELKYKHVVRLHEAVEKHIQTGLKAGDKRGAETAERWKAVWNETFGGIQEPQWSSQKSLFGSEHLSERVIETSSNGSLDDRQTTSQTHTVKRDPQSSILDPYTVNRDPLPEAQQAMFAAGSSPPPAQELPLRPGPKETHRDVAKRLWEVQNELRHSVMPSSLRLEATDAGLARIVKVLEAGHSELHCRQALQVCADGVTANPEAATWFDGVSNWRMENFCRLLGRVGVKPASAVRDVTKGSLRAVGYDEYAKGAPTGEPFINKNI